MRKVILFSGMNPEGAGGSSVIASVVSSSSGPQVAATGVGATAAVSPTVSGAAGLEPPPTQYLNLFTLGR